MKFQALIRGQHVRHSDIGVEVHKIHQVNSGYLFIFHCASSYCLILFDWSKSICYILHAKHFVVVDMI